MRLKPLSLALIPVAVITAPLVAQMPTAKPGSDNPALVTAGNYQIESNHSQIIFSYDHMGFTHNYGLIAAPTGTMTLDPKKPQAAKVNVTIPIANIRTGVAALDEHLTKPEFFDAAKYPTATFVSTAVMVKGKDTHISGNLTIKGITKPVVLDVEFYGAGKGPPQMGGRENVGFKAETKVRRSDFNMGYGVPIVDDEIPLKIIVAFEKI